MLKNIYAPLSGGIAQERMLEVLANNMANTNTTGYKEEQISFSAMDSNPWDSYPSPMPPAQFKLDMNELFPLHGNDMGYSAIANVNTSFTQGSLQKTGNSLDVALQGDGFFSVNTPFGERFSRDGSFSLTTDGTLVTKNGNVVVGEKGAITGLKEGEVKILPGGEVYLKDTLIDKIKVTNFTDKTVLQKLGENLFVHDGAPENKIPFTGEVSKGYLESSNVNTMRNLTNMIIAHRQYEALQKAVKSHDQTMEMSSNKIGTVN
jgi:flagellar basal-body rod protein FlgF